LTIDGWRRDHVAERVPLAELLAEARVLLEEPRALDGALHHGHEHVEVERLRQVIVSALRHRLDGVGDGAERRHHDEGARREDRPRLLHEADAVQTGHLEVGQHDVGAELLELAQRLEAVGRSLGRVALFPEDLGEGSTRVGLVVDDEDSAPTSHGGRLPHPPARRTPDRPRRREPPRSRRLVGFEINLVLGPGQKVVQVAQPYPPTGATDGN
jgi:hypothetical protein